MSDQGKSRHLLALKTLDPRIFEVKLGQFLVFLSLRMKIIALIQLNFSRQNNLVPESGLWFVVVLSFCGFQGDLESPKDLK